MGDFSESSLPLTQLRSLEFTLCYCEVTYFHTRVSKPPVGRRLAACFCAAWELRWF